MTGTVSMSHYKTAEPCALVNKLQANARRCLVLVMAVLSLFAGGCVTRGTVVDSVWLDSARGGLPLGKTMVVSLGSTPDTRSALEMEWARQLRERGVDAHPLNDFLPADLPIDDEAVIRLLKNSAFESLLVSNITGEKYVNREISTSSKVAVVKTEIYDVGTKKVFWKAQSDTFLGGDKNTVIRDFVSRMIEEIRSSALVN